MFIAASFTTLKICKQTKYPSRDEWIKKMWYKLINIDTHSHTNTHTHTLSQEYHLAIKNNEILPFIATQTDLGGIMLSEMLEKNNKSHIISLLCGIWKTKQRNKQNRNRLSDKESGWQRGRQLRGTNFQL